MVMAAYVFTPNSFAHINVRLILICLSAMRALLLHWEFLVVGFINELEYVIHLSIGTLFVAI